MLPSAEIQCPYCGESIEVVIDDSAGDQRYIEDCQVCCRPISIAVTQDADGQLAISVRAENDV
jgi:transposase-like protein